MKTAYLIDDNGSVFVANVRGFVPENMVAEIPNDINKSDYKYVKYAVAGDGIDVYVDTDMKADDLEQSAQEELNRTISEVRRLRNMKLQQSDWTQLQDVDLTSQEVSDWQAYRTALKDLPENQDMSGSIVWPTEPGSN